MKDAHQEAATAFGKVLKRLRDGAGLSQEDLAEKADLDRTYPSLLERGLRSPTLGMFLRISLALGIEPGMLMRMTTRRMEVEDETKGS
jgi:transcriptional regulator with XRE-family HTH domain